MTVKSSRHRLLAFCVPRSRPPPGGKRLAAERCVSDPAVSGVRAPLTLDRGEEVEQAGTVARQVGEVPTGLEIPAQDVAGHRWCLQTEETADVIVDEVQDLIGNATSGVGVL